MVRRRAWICIVGVLVVASVAVYTSSQTPAGQRGGDAAERFTRMSREAEERGLAEAFKGITTDGTVRPRLFAVRATGVSTGAVRVAAETFLASLTEEQRKKSTFPVDDPEWRKWMNQHFYVRQGVSFGEMNEAQKEAAFELVAAGLSAKGLKLSQDVMKLNHTLGELTGRFEEYGEGKYHVTVMGTPSDKGPWGWQLDGHHLIVNYFVLGDQVVMTPAFWGSEPVVARGGKYKGTAILQEEQERGLAFLKSLDDGQRKKAVLEVSKTGNNNLTEAFKDNVVLDYAGVKGSELTGEQREKLAELVGLFVGNMREGHARVKMEEVRRHLGETYFAWIGGSEAGSVFYYRIHSPVVLIEFDHQKPIALGDRNGPPTREHVHVVVRTPNGNDYGKDLLRQHYAAHWHPQGK